MLSTNDVITTLAEQRNYLQQEFGVQRIGVFGSYARGDQTIHSDIDFVVEFRDGIQDLFETKYRLRQFLSETFGKHIDLANLEAIKPYVLQEISPEIRYA